MVLNLTAQPDCLVVAADTVPVPGWNALQQLPAQVCDFAGICYSQLFEVLFKGGHNDLVIGFIGQKGGCAQRAGKVARKVAPRISFIYNSPICCPPCKLLGLW